MSKRDKITARLRLQFGVTVVFLAIAAHDGLAIPSVRSPEIHPDRQFRGQIRGIQIYASRIGQRGALSLDAIRKLQH